MTEIVKLLDWFEPNELEPCERCGDAGKLRLEETGTVICFSCGYIAWAGGETSVSKIQGRGPLRSSDP